jgi:eukaryotic-like serine/threonine-protein kinase
MRERDIFMEALQKPSAAERTGYLQAACEGDSDLRGRVDRLLVEHESPKSFILDAPPEAALAAAAAATIDADAEFASLGAPTFLTPPGTVIGRYKLLEPIGEGGYGTVFMAEQTTPVHRKVALKIIKAGMDTRQVIARFEAERQALALMDHPNIARVFDAGVTETGRPYFVMELVKGLPITKYCDAHRLSPRQRLALFVQVCHAVQHAHQKGIIHRDLKPTNVLIALYDGKPVPKVIDFGVAKATGQRLTERTMFTGFGDVIGTLEYMSPEQAELNQLDVDTRSDIYSLGVLLYELLTGSTPLESKRAKQTALLEALRFIREEEPPRPSTRLSTAEQLPSIAANRGLEPKKLRGLVKGELDWIVLKALEKDRSRRYETANGMAKDVQRYLDDDAVQACPPSAMYRFRKFARRHKRALASAAVLALAALVGVTALATSTVLVSRANRELSASVLRERITVAHRELSIGNVSAALQALDFPEEQRGWEWHYLMRLRKFEPLVLQDRTEVMGLAFSADGEWLASAGADDIVKVWNSRTGQVLQEFSAQSGSLLSVAFHCDRKYIASVGADKQVKVWDLATTDVPVFTGPCDASRGDPVRKFGSACTVAFSPDGRLLAAGSDGVVTVWDWKTRKVVHTFPGHEKNAISVAFSRDGRRLASASTGEAVNIWDLQAGAPLLQTFSTNAHPVSALAFSPDGDRLAEASLNRKVRLWDTATGEYQTLPHDGTVQSVTFSHDGRRLASTGQDKTVHIWDTTTGREIPEVLALHGHAGPCGSVAFSPDGHRLASASLDKTIRVWDATPLRGDESEELLTFTEHGDEIRALAVSSDGRVASASVGTSVKVWDGATGNVSAEFDAQSVTAFCLAWQADGKRIASASWDGRLHTVWVWDAQTGKKIFSLPSGPPYFALAFSPDGRYLITGNGSGTLQVWDALTGAEIGTLGAHNHEIRRLVFSPDGKHLASASGEGIAKLWDASKLADAARASENPEARLTLAAHVPGPSMNIAFSPDGKRLGAGGENNMVEVWDVQTGNLLQTFAGHKRDVCAVAFSHDGRWIASGSGDSTVKIWDAGTGECVRTFRDHTGLVSIVAFSPDDRRLYSGSRDHTVKVWDPTQVPAKQAPHPPEARKAGGP